MRDGAKEGAAIGFLIWLGVDLLYYGWDGGILRLHLLDAVVEGIRWGGAGAVVALVIGSGPGETRNSGEARGRRSALATVAGYHHHG